MGVRRSLGQVSIVRPKRELSSGQSIRRTYYDLMTADDKDGYWLVNSRGQVSANWSTYQDILIDAPESWTIGEWDRLSEEVRKMIREDQAARQRAQEGATDSTGV